MDEIARTQKKNIFLISELEHIDEMLSFLSAHPFVSEEGFILISLDAEVDIELTKRKLSFTSGKSFRSKEPLCMTLAEAWAEEALNKSVWSDFSYKDISLARLYFFPLQAYLMSLVYYADMVGGISSSYPETRNFFVFRTHATRPSRGFSLENKRIDALIDVVAHVAHETKRECSILGEESVAAAHSSFFEGKRRLFGILISILNFTTALLVPKKTIKIFASEYWKNLSPYLPDLPNAEVALFDRMEAFQCGLQSIFAQRMQFINFDAYTCVSNDAKKAKTHFLSEWNTGTRLQKGSFVLNTISFEPLIHEALNVLLNDAIHNAIDAVDAAYALLRTYKPHVVILRSTMSAQIHFVILARVARSLGIPSLEMQHGLEYFGPGSMDRRHASEYMGVYGDINIRDMRETNDTETTPVIIGSPRFDVYAQTTQIASKRGKEITLLCIAPAIIPGLATDSYEVAEYFRWIKTVAVSTPNLRIIVKLRPGIVRENFYMQCIEDACSSVSYVVARTEALSELYPQSDIVTSCYSTAAIEALQCGKPVVYLSFSPEQKMMGDHHFTQYEKAGALRVADSAEECAEIVSSLACDQSERNTLALHAQEFIHDNYAFDGKASKRAAALIEDLAAGIPVTSAWNSSL